jgi:hypothetical protein
VFFTENRPRNEKINQESISFHPHYIHSFCMLIHYLSKSPVLYLTCLYEYSLFRLPSLSVFLLYLHRMSHLNLRPAAIPPYSLYPETYHLYQMAAMQNMYHLKLRFGHKKIGT